MVPRLCLLCPPHKPVRSSFNQSASSEFHPLRTQTFASISGLCSSCFLYSRSRPCYCNTFTRVSTYPSRCRLCVTSTAVTAPRLAFTNLMLLNVLNTTFVFFSSSSQLCRRFRVTRCVKCCYVFTVRLDGFVGCRLFVAGDVRLFTWTRSKNSGF